MRFRIDFTNGSYRLIDDDSVAVAEQSHYVFPRSNLRVPLFNVTCCQHELRFKHNTPFPLLKNENLDVSTTFINGEARRVKNVLQLDEVYGLREYHLVVTKNEGYYVYRYPMYTVLTIEWKDGS